MRLLSIHRRTPAGWVPMPTPPIWRPNLWSLLAVVGMFVAVWLSGFWCAILFGNALMQEMGL